MTCVWSSDGSYMCAPTTNLIYDYQSIDNDTAAYVATLLWYQFSQEYQKINITSPKDLQQFIRYKWKGLDTFCVLQKGSYVLGTIALNMENGIGFVTNLYVHPHFRKQGWAEYMLQHAEKYFQTFRCHKMMLQCSAHLVPFYQKQNWTMTHVTQEKDYVFEKTL